MAALRSASFFLICFLIGSSEAQEIITAERGQDVILPCKVPNINNIIRAVEWSRPDQDPEYVLFYRDGRLNLDNQDPFYQNRVDLQDKEMKDGDASLILKNVTKEDTGKYECRVFEEGNKDPISIDLVVLEPGRQDGNTEDGGDKDGIIAGSVGGVILLLLAVLAAAGFLIYGRHMRKNPNLPVPPDEAAAEKML